MASHQLQEYLLKYENLYFQLSERKAIKLWVILMTPFSKMTSINAKM